MLGIDQLIVIIWFLPVIFLIVLPLFVACFCVLYALFDVFKPIAGKDHAPDPTHFHTATQPAPRAWPAPNPQSS